LAGRFKYRAIEPYYSTQYFAKGGRRQQGVLLEILDEIRRILKPELVGNLVDIEGGMHQQALSFQHQPLLHQQRRAFAQQLIG
jgi:hypothetical protein